jgi:hypothetical protein
MKEFNLQISGDLLEALHNYIARTEKQKGIPIDPKKIALALLWASLEEK